jgi:hypothetical protein
MSKKITRNTTVAEVLAANPALIEVFDDWGLHLVPSTAVAMNAPLQKAAAWHAIRDADKLIAELNAKLNSDPHQTTLDTNGHNGKR